MTVFTMFNGIYLMPLNFFCSEQYSPFQNVQIFWSAVMWEQFMGDLEENGCLIFLLFFFFLHFSQKLSCNFSFLFSFFIFNHCIHPDVSGDIFNSYLVVLVQPEKATNAKKMTKRCGMYFSPEDLLLKM